MGLRCQEDVLVSRDGYAVIDVDAHFALERLNNLIKYLDEPWRTRVAAEPGLMLPLSLGDRMVGGRIRRDDIPYPRQNEAVIARTGPMTPAKIPGVMERLGIDASIQINNALLLMGHLSVRDLAVALCSAYINYMLAEVVDPAKGIYTCVVAPWQDPEEGAAIIHRVGAHPAVVGVCLTSAGANPPLGDIRYNPVYAAAQDHDLPIVYHSAPGVTLTEGGSGYVDGFQRLIEAHSLGFLLSNQIQLTSVILQGVPERYPKLKFVFQESGVFWAPALAYRLDGYYLKRGSEAPLLKALPSEYLLDRFYFGTQPIEEPKNPRHLEAIFSMMNGAEHFMFASDYPHFDYDDASAITTLSFLSPQAKANVLAGNAMRVFNFRKGGTQQWESTLSRELATFPTGVGSSSS